MNPTEVHSNKCELINAFYVYNGNGDEWIDPLIVKYDQAAIWTSGDSCWREYASTQSMISSMS